MIKMIFSIMFILLFLFPVVGCKKDKPPQQRPQAQQVRPAPPPQPEAVQEEVKKVVREEYAYNPRGRRDPFLSLLATAEAKPEKRKGASPIESYDINELKLLAIAWDKDRPYALIRLPDNKTYTIIEGTGIGLRGGTVVRITPEAVLIREYVEDYRGDIKTKDTILKLHKGGE
jgi:type IV pilus assembly protein PilP